MMQSISARAFEANWALAGLLLCCVTVPAAGQAVTAESLQGATIEATVSYDVRGTRDGEPFTSPGSVTYVLRFAAGGAFTGSVRRTTTARGNPVTSTTPMSGTLGTAQELGGLMSGHVVWALSGNTLRMLRTYE